MDQAQAWTIGRLLTWTTDFLKQHGADSPRLDAEVLLAQARRCERIELYTAYDQVADPAVRDSFRDLVRRRAAGTPVAYLVGQREFFSLAFFVSPAVLIPRPETEFLVTATLDLIKRFGPNQPRVLDVGTGSGAVAVAIAKHATHSSVLATDISPPALEMARRNVGRHRLDDRIRLQLSDLLEQLSGEERFDYIVSNPPYVSEQEFGQLATEVREHEPRSALVAGPLGTEVVDRLVDQASQKLNPRGWLLIEISPMIHNRVVQRLKNDDRYEDPVTTKDLAGQPRVVHARRAEG